MTTSALMDMPTLNLDLSWKIVRQMFAPNATLR